MHKNGCRVSVYLSCNARFVSSVLRCVYRYAFFYIAINAGVKRDRKKQRVVYRSSDEDDDFAELEKQKV